jgi:hypothetical protein
MQQGFTDLEGVFARLVERDIGNEPLNKEIAQQTYFAVLCEATCHLALSAARSTSRPRR